MGADADMLSAPLVGRGDELARLSRAADDAAAGAGRCVFIAGEAGIGKTRLVAELRAGFRGVVFEGRCYEEDTSFAFSPLQTGLRGLRQAMGDTRAEPFQRRAAIVARLLPELAEPSGTLASLGEGADPAASQRALFEAVAGLLFDTAARQPLLVVFEDLHWSDEGTTGFFRFLARRLSGRPVLLIGTYRPVAAPAPLADLLLSLQREPHVEQILVLPLSRPEIDGLLRSMFDSSQPISSEFLDAVTAFSEGNPLYVEELVRAMIQAGDIRQVEGGWIRKPLGEVRVPASMQETVRRRSEALNPGTRQLLTVAAVAGREFDFEVLAQVTGQAEPDLVAGLKDLIRAGLIGEERPDQFAFRHALLREAVLGELLTRERRALHGHVAHALKRIGLPEREPSSAELAYHHYEAEAWEEAMVYARRAEEEARGLDATREALTQATRALSCAEHLGIEPPLDLLLERAELYDRSGEFDLAQADLAAALAGAERGGRLREAWQALLKLGTLWAARDYDHSLAWFQRGLGVADALEDPLARAETLNRIGNVYLNRDLPGEALPYHQAAIAAFESTGDLAGQANTLELMGICYYNLPDVLTGAACEESALALATAAGASDGRARSAVFHASIHLLLPLRFETEVGPPVEGERLIRQGEEALRFARTMGWPAGEAQALGLLGGFHGLLGEYGRGLAYLYESLQLVEQLEHAAGISAAERMIAGILVELMAYDEAAERLRRAWSAAREGGAQLFADIAALALCQALAARRRREDVAEAESLLSGLFRDEKLAGGRIEREALAVRAELELAQGKAATALATVEALVATTCHLSDHGLRAVPRLALLLGQAQAAMGRVAEADDALEAASAGAESQGRKGLQWRAHAALGRLFLDLKQRRAAQDQFEQARTLIGELAANLPDTSLRIAPLSEAFVRKALATMPLPPAPTPRRVAKEAHHGLTERERAVASLVAEGRSNREIADALVISERTAERHVANILAKLGLASRVQLASWVTENLAPA